MDKKSSTDIDEDKTITTSDLLDGRKVGDWKSRYYEDKKCKKMIYRDAIFLTCLILISLSLLLLNYLGIISSCLNIPEEKEIIFSRMFTCTTSGLLGGTIFDIKWFYRSVARGMWNADRFWWRIFSPIISLCFALILGCILNENIIVYGSGFLAASLGFLSGYFSDKAAGKMAEVADVLFNTNKKESDNNENK